MTGTRNGKRAIGRIIGICALIAVCSPSAAMGQSPGVVNGNFEDGFFSFWGGDIANDWGATWRGSFDEARWDDHYFGGTHSWVMRMKEIGTGFEAGLIQQVGGLTPGETYTFSAEAYQFSTGTTAWIAVDPNGGTVLPAAQTQFPNIANQWNSQQVVGTVGTTGVITVYLWAYREWGDRYDVYFDNASLILGNQDTGTLTGTVTDEVSSPLAGATVEIAPLGWSTTTSPQGIYEFANVPTGTYEVTAGAVGYESQTAASVSINTDTTTVQDFALPLFVPDTNFVTIQGDQFYWDGQVVKLKGTNYYPREHMWADMWNSWDWADITAETQMMHDLGLNCVRILVPYDNGGWNGPNPPETRLQMLEDLVNHFGDNGMRSCVTLFDWEVGFPAAGTSTEAEHISYLTAIVTRLKDNPYVLCWDVKNEPDHPANYGSCDCDPGACGNWDCNPSQRDKIVSWLERMCNAVRAIDPNHPVSAGMRWWQNLPDVLAFVDFAIFHSYWPNVDQEITETKSFMGTDIKPIVVEEWGWPSHPYPCNRDGTVIYDYTEAEQLSVYETHLTSFTNNDIAGGLQWMTFDAKSYGSDPNESFEHYFGLWRYDLTLKPAGEYYRDNYPVQQFFQSSIRPVGNLTAENVPGKVQLGWMNPTNASFAGTMVRVSTTDYPTDETDGDLVCDRTASPGSADSCQHIIATPGVVHYYAAFAYDDGGNYAEAVTTSVLPMAPGDFDADGDCDVADFGKLQICLTGSVAYVEDPDCQETDWNRDDHVDQTDVTQFLSCMSGAGVPVDLSCID